MMYSIEPADLLLKILVKAKMVITLSHLQLKLLKNILIELHKLKNQGQLMLQQMH